MLEDTNSLDGAQIVNDNYSILEQFKNTKLIDIVELLMSQKYAPVAIFLLIMVYLHQNVCQSK